MKHKVNIRSGSCASRDRDRERESRVHRPENAPKHYSKVKVGLKKYNPAAIVLWAFYQIPSAYKGLTSRRVISYIKRFYENAKNPRTTGQSLGTMLRYAVNFGLLVKRGNRYFLSVK